MSTKGKQKVDLSQDLLGNSRLEKTVTMDLDELRAVIDAKTVEEMRREHLRAAGMDSLIPEYDNTIALLKGLIEKWADADWVITEDNTPVLFMGGRK